MRKVFVAIDTDGSGTISREEFASAMQAHPQLSTSAVSALFDQIDFSRTGELAYNEFLAATIGSTQMHSLDEQAVRTIFFRLDQDEDGILSRADLVHSLGAVLTEEEIDLIFTELDAPSGRLHFNDLLRLMTADRGRGAAGMPTCHRPPTTDP